MGMHIEHTQSIADMNTHPICSNARVTASSQTPNEHPQEKSGQGIDNQLGCHGKRDRKASRIETLAGFVLQVRFDLVAKDPPTNRPVPPC
jgi:hypothetical protein